MMRKTLLILLTFVLMFHAYAQQISGFVYDNETRKPLADANITILNTTQGVTSEKAGRFLLNLPTFGKYVVHASMIGYKKFEKEISITSDTTLNLDIYLQPEIINLSPEIVITARRAESEQLNAPDAITIINSARMQQESPRTAPDALFGSTGVFIQKTNHGGGAPIIRGLIGNQNLIMVDGIRLNNATFRYGPNQYLNTIDPFIIQRIEVVRGAGSVLYGSDAMGGVIQVISSDIPYSDSAKIVRGRITGKWMNKDMEKTTRAELTLSDKKIAFLGGLTYNDFGNNYAGQGIGVENPTGYSSYSANSKVKLQLSEKNELTLAYQYNRQDDVPRYDRISSGYQKYHFDPQIRNLGYMRLKSHLNYRYFSHINLTAFYNQSYEKRILQKTGQELITDEIDIVNTTGGIIEISSKTARNWSFISGIDYYHDKVNSRKSETFNDTIKDLRGYYPDNATSASIALFTTHTIQITKFCFILGGRYSTFSIIAIDPGFQNIKITPNAFVGSASVMYNVNNSYKLIASTYTAFRAPNLNDLSSFGSFNYGIEVPNPGLHPEKSLTFELGLKSRQRYFSGSLFVYRSKLSDLIVRVPGRWNGLDSINKEKVYMKNNFSRAYIQGVETEFRYELSAWLKVYGHLTYTYGQNITANEPMTRIPPLNGGFGLYYNNLHGLWSRIEWNVADKQSRLSAGDIKDTRIPEGGTPGWNIINLRTGYSKKLFTVSAGVNNIFNQSYRTHGSGVHGVGRSFWIMIELGLTGKVSGLLYTQTL